MRRADLDFVTYYKTILIPRLTQEVAAIRTRAAANWIEAAEAAARQQSIDEIEKMLNIQIVPLCTYTPTSPVARVRCAP